MRIYYPMNGIGLGHVRRSVPLANGLIFTGYDVAASTYMGTSAFRYLKRKLRSRRIYGVPPIQWGFTGDGGVDPAKTFLRTPEATVLAVQHYFLERKIFRKEKPDLLISDMRFIPLLLARRRGIPSIVVVSYMRLPSRFYSKFINLSFRSFGGLITRLELRADLLIHTDLDPPYSLYLWSIPSYVLKEKRITFIGPVLDKKARQFLRENIEKLKHQKKVEKNLEDRLVITVVPSGVGKNVMYVVKRIIDIAEKLKKHDIYFIVSTSQPSKTPKIIYRKENIEVWDWFEDIYEYYLVADIAMIQPGPAKIFEAMTTGTAVLGIPPRLHAEMQNLAVRINDLNIGLGLKEDWYTLRPSKLVDAIQTLVNRRAEIKRGIDVFREKMKHYDPQRKIVEIVKKTIS